MTKKKNKVVEKIRRKKGEGSIYQQGNGQWTGSVRIEHADGSKSRRTVYGHSEIEVSKKLVELTGKLNILKNSLYSGKTFGQLFTDWLLVFKKPSVTPRTFEGNIRNYNLHIKPYIENMDIQDITTPVIQQIMNELLATGLSTAMVKKIKFLFVLFLISAVLFTVSLNITVFAEEIDTRWNIERGIL
ncbi:MAG: hypothetical protein RR247_04130, partial [Clostridia bacterium]